MAYPQTYSARVYEFLTLVVARGDALRTGVEASTGPVERIEFCRARDAAVIRRLIHLHQVTLRRLPTST